MALPVMLRRFFYVAFGVVEGTPMTRRCGVSYGATTRSPSLAGSW